MKKKIYLLVILTLLLGCTSVGGDKYFWTKSKCMPLMDDGKGNKVIDIESKLLIGQYLSHGSITQNYKGKIDGAVTAVWKVTKLKGGGSLILISYVGVDL